MDDKALGNVAGNPKPVQQTLTNFVIAEEEASPMEKLQGDISRMLVMLQSLTIRAVPRTLIGGGVCLFIYSCSARPVSFQIDKFEFDFKRN